MNSVILSGMVAKLTVIFFILLCFLIGMFLTLLPWFRLNGFGEWGDNYLLAYISERAGVPLLRSAISSNWFRGAVTGIGVLNLFLAFWEMAHFNESVAKLEGNDWDTKL